MNGTVDSKELKPHPPKTIHPYVILISIMILAGVLSYLIPAGSYTRVPGPLGRTMIDPNTFVAVERAPVNIMNFITAIPRGFVDAASVVILVFMIGGSFGVIKKTGIIEIGVQALTVKLSKRGILIIPAIFTVFAVIAAFVGGVELCLIYIPILMPLLLALGFDSMVTMALALCATAAGYTAALTNPFTIGIGHTIGGLPMYSGMPFRALTLLITIVIGIAYIMAYAYKVQKDPTSSLVYEEDLERRKEYANVKQMIVQPTQAHKMAGISALIVFLCMIGGIVKWGWGMYQMAGFFMLFGLIPGLFAKLTLNEICDAFTDGFKDILVGALICGIARGIAVVMDDAQVVDTIIHYLAKIVVELPPKLTAVGLLGVTTIFNAIVPSGSGKALIMMPIMLPLADFANVTRQTAILAYQFGDGISNIIWPASGYFMAALALGKISYAKWIKFFLPLGILWTIQGALLLMWAHSFNWGPF